MVYFAVENLVLWVRSEIIGSTLRNERLKIRNTKSETISNDQNYNDINSGYP